MNRTDVPRRQLRPRLPVAFNGGDFLSTIRKGERGPGRSWPAGDARTFLLSSGRAALWLLLKGLGLPAGARVGVPLFCCEAVFEAVERAGCAPTFLDVNPETFVLDAEDASVSVDAVVAVHLFGNPVDLTRLRSPRGPPVVEDCAHSFFGEIHGTPVGSLGVGAMYSFGLGKPVSLGRLGAAVTRTTGLSERGQDLHRSLPAEGARGKVSRAVTSKLVAALYREPWYGMFAFKVAQQYESTIDPMGKEAASYQAAPSELIGIVADKVDRYRGTIEAQRDAWKHLEDVVADVSKNRFVPQATTKGCISDRWLFALRCPSTRDRDELVDRLGRQGVDSIKFYDRVPAIARERFGYKGGAPSAESLCKSTVVVPVRVPTDRDDGGRLAAALANAIRGAG